MRYLVFGFLDYYPSGGLDDIILITDDVSEVEERIAWFNEEVRYENTERFEVAHLDNIQVYDTVIDTKIYDAHKREVGDTIVTVVNIGLED